jgi:hypothetical protein
MKNTVQARKNGATKPSSVQTKTTSRVKPEEQSRPSINSLIGEAMAAKAQSAGLHMLLADVLFTKDEGTYGEEIQYGINELIITTHDRMDRAFEAIETLANSKPEVAS